MPRNVVRDFDIQQFRLKLEAFSRRQSEDMNMNANPRKRSSPSWQDMQEGVAQYTEDWRDESETTKKARTLVPQRDQHQMSLDNISELELPEPTVPIHNYGYDFDTDVSMSNTAGHQSPFTPYARAQRQTLHIPSSPDEPIPSIEGDDFDAPSTTYSSGSSSYGEPRTPELPSAERCGTPFSFKGLVDLDSMPDHERNLLVALAPQASKEVLSDLGLLSGKFTMSSISKENQWSQNACDKRDPAEADFESTFDQFMNVE